MSDTYLLPNKQLAAAMLAPVRSFVTVTLVIVVLLLAFWCICLGMYYGPWRNDMTPLAQLFRDALSAVSVGEPMAHVSGIADRSTRWLHETLFVATGMDAPPHSPAGSASPFNQAIDKLIGNAGAGFQVVIVATQVFAVRLALLTGMLPLLILGYVVAHVDGHAERAIRRACAGRESAALYHQSKYFQYGLLGTLLIATLCLPMHLNPVHSMLAFVILTALIARTQWTYYKKYL